MATKQPEEGEIWEWRAFGSIAPELFAKVHSQPLRMGLIDVEENDIYLPSRTSDHNVKLRRTDRDWVLKVKPLIARSSRAVELYREGPALIYRFPLDSETLKQIASLLAVQLNEETLHEPGYGMNEAIGALAAASPPISPVEVRKTRSQYQFGRGWVELSRAAFPRGLVDSLSIQSLEKERVEIVLDELKPGNELRPMNYIQACFEWG